MKTISSLKIKTKLIIGFSIIFLMISFLGINSIRNLYILNNEVKELYNDNLLTVLELKEFEKNMVEIRSNLLIILYHPSDLESSNSNIDSLIKENELLLSNFEKTNKTKEESFLYKDFVPLFHNYQSYKKDFINLVKNKKQLEAEFLFPKLVETREKMFKQLEKIILLNENDSKEKYNHGNLLYKKSLSFSISTIILILFVSVAIVSLILKRINQGINSVNEMTKKLASNDLSFKFDIKIEDEIGIIEHSIDFAIQNLKKIIFKISENASDVSSSSQELSATVQELLSTMESIQVSTQEMAKGSEDLSSSTEQINSSLQDITSSSSFLHEFINKSSSRSIDIKNRAINTKINAKKSIENSSKIYKENYNNINSAIKETSVVDQISDMAKKISAIAYQTNLLSLNASIEAARAGESGKGFAVVAQEVKKLAEESTITASEIQNIIQKVNLSVANLSKYSFEMLQFMENTVNPDYEKMLHLGDQYEEDANFVEDFSNQLSTLSSSLSESLNEISIAIQSNSSTAEETAAGSESILQNINETNYAINDIAKTSLSQTSVAQDLVEIVGKFKL